MEKKPYWVKYTRIELGNLDVVSGLIFLIGLWLLLRKPALGLSLMGFAILKQFSGR